MTRQTQVRSTEEAPAQTDWEAVAADQAMTIALLKSEQPAQQEPVAHCTAGPEHCPVCLAETRSLALAAAVGYVQRNTPQLVSEEICGALKKASPPATKPWMGLTEEEIEEFFEGMEPNNGFWLSFGRAIEAKLREKNA